MAEFKSNALAVAVAAALFLLSENSRAALPSDTTDSAQPGTGVTLSPVLVKGDTEQVVADVHQEKAPQSRATLNKEQLKKFAGLDNATGVLRYMPGVHTGASDDTGVSEATFSIRGFSQDQIGVIRDGVPLNDPSFQTPHTDFLGDPENYESVGVVYGGAAINAPTLTASGGSLVIDTIKPTKDAGLFLKQSIGSNLLQKTFLRVNTGEVNGFSSWFSASHTSADLWKGPGDLDSNRYEGDLQYKWGDNNSINAVLSSFSMRSNSYFHPTKSQYQSEKYDTDYPNVAYPTQGGGTNGVADSATPGASAAANRADFKIQTYALNGIFNLSDALQLKVDPYFVRVAEGTAALSVLPVSESGLGVDLNGDGDKLDSASASLQLLPTQYRTGVTSRLDWTVNPSHTVEFGAWADYTHSRVQFPLVSIKGNGKPTSIDGSNPIRDASGSAAYTTNQGDEITAQKFWLQDTWALDPKLTLVTSLGWQHTRLEGDNHPGTYDFATGALDGAGYSRSADYNRFLPSLSLNYALDQHQQFYYNTSSNLRVPAAGSLYGDASLGKQKPETTWNQELGWRYSTPDVLLSAALFYDKFRNQQVSYAAGGVTSYFNAGDVTTRGIELTLNGNLPDDFNYFGSWTFTRAEQQDDYQVAGAGIVDTKGKQVFNTPRQLFTAGVGYDNKTVYANVLGRHTGSYYGDLANDEKVGGYTLFDINSGYRLKGIGGGLKEAVFSVNVNNVLNKHYLAGTYSGSVSANPADGSFYSAPQYSVGEPRSIVSSVSVEF